MTRDARGARGHTKHRERRASSDTRCEMLGAVDDTRCVGVAHGRDAARRAGLFLRRYAYTLAGEPVTQPVTDWVGENPMAGRQFTYEIRLDPAQIQGGQMILVNVLTDTP